MNKKHYQQITSDQFYKLGGFSNPNLFKNDKGHWIVKDSVAYQEFMSAKK